MYKEISNQLSFSSLELKALKQSKTHKFLHEIDKIVNWQKIEQLLTSLYCDNNGRPGYNPLILFKGLLLEQWYQLSDLDLEEELKDRLSFRKFVGLKHGENPPDETTLVRFRQRLREANLEEALFEFIKQELRKDNLEIKQGKCLLTDASLIESPYGTESKGRDDNGDFVKDRDGQIKKGYKVHLTIDQKDSLIEDAIFTFASCHESRFLEQLLSKTKQPIKSVLADKGYASDERKREFRQQGIYYGILEKRKRNQKSLTKKQNKKNYCLTKIRSGIERVFAVIKKHYGFDKVRYFGLKKNTAHLWSVLSAYNLQLVACRNIRAFSGS